jgi:hypothetical protein
MTRRKLNDGGAIVKRPWGRWFARPTFALAVMLSGSALTPARADTIFYYGFAIHGTNDIA